MVTKIKTNYNDGVKINDYVCLSDDSKPTDCGNGSTLLEMDTGNTFYFNAEGGWIQTGITKRLVSIAITTPPTKVDYVEGEEFDATGAAITATYSDETTASVTGVWPAKVMAMGDTSVTVSYTENGLRRTADQAVTVSEAE